MRKNTFRKKAKKINFCSFVEFGKFERQFDKRVCMRSKI